MGVVFCLEVEGEVSGIVVNFEHVEDMIGGSEDHFFVFGEDHGLKDVDGLGDVGHVKAFVVIVKDMECEGGDEGVTQRILLVEEAGVGVGFGVVPGAPFVEDDTHAIVGIVLIHDGAVFGDEFVHEEGFLEDIEPIAFVKIGGGFSIAGVAVQGQAVHEVAVTAFGIGHEGFGPAIVFAVGTAGDFVDGVVAKVAYIGLVTPVFVGIVFGAHVAAAAPVFVSNAPIF